MFIHTVPTKTIHRVDKLGKDSFPKPLWKGSGFQSWNWSTLELFLPLSLRCSNWDELFSNPTDAAPKRIYHDFTEFPPKENVGFFTNKIWCSSECFQTYLFKQIVESCWDGTRKSGEARVSVAPVVPTRDESSEIAKWKLPKRESKLHKSSFPSQLFHRSLALSKNNTLHNPKDTTAERSLHHCTVGNLFNFSQTWQRDKTVGALFPTGFFFVVSSTWMSCLYFVANFPGIHTFTNRLTKSCWLYLTQEERLLVSFDMWRDFCTAWLGHRTELLTRHPNPPIKPTVLP